MTMELDGAILVMIDTGFSTLPNISSPVSLYLSLFPIVILNSVEKIESIALEHWFNSKPTRFDLSMFRRVKK